MTEKCEYCGETVTFVKDENGKYYCPNCGFYKEDEETESK